MRSSSLRVQHTSLQFSDSRRQQEHDISKLFARGQGFPIKTGTEAGPDDPAHNANRVLLEKYSNIYNHKIVFGGDNWVAVDRAIVKPHTLRTGRVFVTDASRIPGPGNDRVMPTIRFRHIDPAIGVVNQAAVHYPTRGARPGDPNNWANEKYAKDIHEWMKKVAKGKALAFVNGDFNMDDRQLDWSFGKNWTSMADELKSWKNTGHGPIDGFASYDKDGRVKAYSFQVLTDKQFRMYGDHFVCRGIWTIRHLKVR